MINNTWKERYGHIVTQVTIGNEDGEVEITVQEEVEEALMENNNKRFLLIYGIPLMQEDRLHNNIGNLGDTPSSDDILNSKCGYPEGTDIDTMHLLLQLSEIVSKWTSPR